MASRWVPIFSSGVVSCPVGRQWQCPAWQCRVAVAVAVDGRGLLGKCIEMAVAEWQWQWQWQCRMVVAVQGFAVP